MDWFTIFLIVLGALAVIFLIIGFSLPSKWEVKESKLIDAPSGEIFRYLATMPNWEKWTIWNDSNDSRYSFTYEGPDFGVGAMQSWKFRGRKGYTKIVDTTPGKRIAYVMNMGRGSWEMNGEILLAEKEGKTEVTWRSFGENKTNPSGRIMMKMFKPYMEKDFQKGLERLKNNMESAPETNSNQA